MSAYIVALTRVVDAEAFERYKAVAPAAVLAEGGRYLARGSDVDVLEGLHDGRRVVILEFPDVDAARRFYNGRQYRQARTLRKDAATSTMLLVPGAA